MAVLIPTALSIALIWTGISFGYKWIQQSVQEATEEQALSRFYFPMPEKSKDLPSHVAGAVALRDGSEDQRRVRKLRDATYADEVPSSEGGAVVTIITADPKGGPRGVSGYVRGSTSGSASETMRIDTEHPGMDREGTDHINYYASEHDSIFPKGYYPKTP